MRYGRGDLTYEPLEDWAKLPEGWDLFDAPAVAADSKDHVYVFSRSEHPVVVFDREGNLLRSWGEGTFKRPHGIFIGPDDSIYCVDDFDHTLRKCTPEGKVLMQIGVSGQHSDTGFVPNDFLSVKRAAGPFYLPTSVALSLDGDIYVTDGYANARVHKFSPDGELLVSWGEPGSGPGEFRLPHGIRVGPDGTVYVGDRMNSRVQVFNPQGEFIAQWNDVYQPNDLFLDSEGRMYIGEIGYRSNLPLPGPLPAPEDSYARVTIRNLKGEILASIQGLEKARLRFDDSGEQVPRDEAANRAVVPGGLLSPHGVCKDSHGDLYVGEVSGTRAMAQKRDRSQFHVLHKFVRVPA